MCSWLFSGFGSVITELFSWCDQCLCVGGGVYFGVWVCVVLCVLIKNIC